ncbi:MAG: multicopper oxidase domain-containing protein [Candidatus Krumholzibacteria bacterium]|nr:multicopper oxidase domain-containing protein [Candidatus Krumholzibacteria bacterium]
MNRRLVFRRFVLVLVFASVALAANFDWIAADELLDPATHPKFENPLPIPARIDATSFTPMPGSDGMRRREPEKRPPRFNMEMNETVQWLGLVNGEGEPLMTTVWGYGIKGQGVTYPGPTFVAQRDVPVFVTWFNDLPRYNFPDGPGAHLLPVDPSIHIAHPIRGGIPTVTHLHGGHTESASDGLPEAWYTQRFKETGPYFVTKTHRYDNDQEAATLWYHDHALGITRLNVYAGLAGFYLLRDKNETQLTKNDVLPRGPHEIEIVIQDRVFSDDGALFYPSDDPELPPGAPTPSVIAEFFGDFILVNGVAWPKLEVEPRKYRFRMLNGSDSRFYILEFGNGMGFYQIGTDVGLLPFPVPLTQLLLGPGERADLVVDFTGKEDQQIMLKNFGPDEPFKGLGVGVPADPVTTGLIMRFDVTRPFKPQFPNATVGMGTRLRPDIDPLVQDGAARELVLFEGEDQFGRLRPQLGTLADGSLLWDEAITENPMMDDVEVWEVYNATEDAHPIHLHLVAFQILNREEFTGEAVIVGTDPIEGGTKQVLEIESVSGITEPPAPNERGWKDTAVMLPGQITRVIAKFDREGRYVWHCHILSHEDHEMMRPYHVGPMGGEGTTLADRLGDGMPWRSSLGQNYPNPFNPTTRIRFQLPKAGHADVMIYNVAGEVVRTLASRRFNAGEQVVTWDGKDNAGRSVASGVYFYALRAEGVRHMKKMVMLK